MSNLIDDYYEQDILWGKQKDEEGKNRIIDIASLIPDDVISILDVGCGDGIMLNYLAEHGNHYQRMVGMDKSKSALKYLNTEKVIASIDDIPFPDRSFDLILCLEVLEHLKHNIYPKALLKLQRVAKKYILISVPNNENIKRDFVTCPECGCEFSLYRHLRSFAIDSVSTLFKDFKLSNTKFSGIRKQFIMRASLAKVGKYWGFIEAFPKTALCPQCGYYEDNNVSYLIRTQKKKSKTKAIIKKVIPGRKEGNWLLALYSRNKFS